MHIYTYTYTHTLYVSLLVSTYALSKWSGVSAGYAMSCFVSETLAEQYIMGISSSGLKSGEKNLVGAVPAWGEQKNMAGAGTAWSEKRGEKKMVGTAPAPACRSVEQGMRSKRKESPIAESLIIMLICVYIARVHTNKHAHRRTQARMT